LAAALVHLLHNAGIIREMRRAGRCRAAAENIQDVDREKELPGF